MVQFTYADLFVVGFESISSLSLILTKYRLKSRFASVSLGLKYVLKKQLLNKMNKSKYGQILEQKTGGRRLRNSSYHISFSYRKRADSNLIAYPSRLCL